MVTNLFCELFFAKNHTYEPKVNIYGTLSLHIVVVMLQSVTQGEIEIVWSCCAAWSLVIAEAITLKFWSFFEYFSRAHEKFRDDRKVFVWRDWGNICPRVRMWWPHTLSAFYLQRFPEVRRIQKILTLVVKSLSNFDTFSPIFGW